MTVCSIRKVAVLVGSLRRDSMNAKLARALVKLSAPRLDCHLIEIADLPIYNDDLWESPPAPVLRFKGEIAAADAVLIISPEYNRGLPAVTKNAIDWGSRPHGHGIWNGKPGAIGGASAGSVGTAVMQSQLRHILTACGVITMGLPELYFHFKPDAIDADGKVADNGTVTFLTGWINAFADWIERVA